MIIKPENSFVKITTKEEIDKVSSNQIVRFIFDKELLRYCQQNSIECAVEIFNITEAIFANHFGATFIIVPNKLAKEVQQIADNYLFDTKLLVDIALEREIEELAKEGIDGIIVPQYLLEP